MNPQNFCAVLSSLAVYAPPSCLFWRARWTKWPSANITPISCYTVNWGGCKTFSSVKIFTFFKFLFKLFCSYSLTWSFAVTCSISFSSVSILFLFPIHSTVLTEWDSFYSEFAEEENQFREMGYVTITITIVFSGLLSFF